MRKNKKTSPIIDPGIDLKSLADAGMDVGGEGSLEPEDARKLRKYRNSMGISGFGVILFGIWNIVKCIMYFTIDTPIRDTILEPFEGSVEAEFIIFASIMMVVLIDLIFRLVVGLSAIHEARGKKKGNGYIVVAILMLAVQLFLLVLSVSLFNTSAGVAATIDETVTFIVDLTAAYALFDMICSAIRVKKIRKKTEGGE